MFSKTRTLILNVRNGRRPQHSCGDPPHCGVLGERGEQAPLTNTSKKLSLIKTKKSAPPGAERLRHRAYSSTCNNLRSLRRANAILALAIAISSL